jgi:predicted permease
MMLDSLVPVFFGMALGYLGGWTRDVDNKHVAELNALVMDFPVPASRRSGVAPDATGRERAFEVVGTTPIASTVLSAAILAAAIYFRAGVGQP